MPHLRPDDRVLIIFPIPPPQEFLDKVKAIQPDVHVTYKQGFLPKDVDPVELAEAFKSATVLITHSCLPASREACPNLRWVCTMSAGVDHIAKNPVVNEPDVQVTGSVGVAGPVMAEWYLMMVLNKWRRFEKFRSWQQEHKWPFPDADVMMGDDLVGKRVGIIGYGSIGRQVARVSEGLGMQIIAYTSRPRTTPASRRDTSYHLPGLGDPEGKIPIEWYSGTDKQSLHQFLSQKLDIVVLLTPITDQTRGLIGEEELKIMGRNAPNGGCFLVNMSRGDVLVQNELIAALKDEKSGILGAALDVATPEPLPADSALWTAPNVYITPHVSALSRHYMSRALRIIELNFAGDDSTPLINKIDFTRGY